jgi:hypothetical protein
MTKATIMGKSDLGELIITAGKDTDREVGFRSIAVPLHSKVLDGAWHRLNLVSTLSAT